MSYLPLSDIRVLDLTRLLPGPLCTLHLSDLGADVVKIEDLPRGDYARWLPPLQKQYSYLFSILNGGKRSFGLDWQKAEDLARFDTLVQASDVVVESYRPGVAESLGFGYDRLRKLNPKLVYASLTGYGQTGPLAAYAGHDLNYLGYTGVLDQMGRQGQPPALSNFQIADIAGGSLSAALAITAALVGAQRTGTGVYLDLAMYDGILAQTVIMLATFQGMGGHSLPRGADLLTGGMPFYDVYETSDNRFMALGALEYKFWQRFCTAMNRPDWLPKHFVFADEAAALRAEIQAVFSTQTQQYWSELLVPADCCCTPVLTLAEALEAPQSKARNLVRSSVHPTEGPVVAYGSPFGPTVGTQGARTPAPALGEHTEEVWADWTASLPHATTL
jgi:crotonobetainyl-CoA:carnitine CoA-transferase CaiB-like acyl-CoA transferase